MLIKERCNATPPRFLPVNYVYIEIDKTDYVCTRDETALRTNVILLRGLLRELNATKDLK